MHVTLRSAVLAVLALLACLAPCSLLAQTPPAATTFKNPAEHSWTLLSETVAPTQHSEQRIEALAALGSMGNDPRAAKLIATSMTDKDLDVRTGAVLAAGENKNPRLLPDLRKALDDAEPVVAYTAAVTLWKLHDHSGADLLTEVADGDRPAGPGLFKGARHSAARTLHNPAALATLGATQGAGLLLGPFGVGVSAYEYARKNGGNSARAVAIDLVAELHTPAVHQELMEALSDKDPVVRAAAAKALGHWSDHATAVALAALLDDSKLPVRLAAAASYLRIAGTGAKH